MTQLCHPAERFVIKTLSKDGGLSGMREKYDSLIPGIGTKGSRNPGNCPIQVRFSFKTGYCNYSWGQQYV